LGGVAPEDRLPEAAYAKATNEAVNRTLSEQARLVATGGHAVILDATFLDPVPRRQIEAELRAWFKPGLHVGPD
jgi:hypothetical protein